MCLLSPYSSLQHSLYFHFQKKLIPIHLEIQVGLHRSERRDHPVLCQQEWKAVCLIHRTSILACFQELQIMACRTRARYDLPLPYLECWPIGNNEGQTSLCLRQIHQFMVGKSAKRSWRALRGKDTTVRISHIPAHAGCAIPLHWSNLRGCCTYFGRHRSDH